MDRIAVLIPCYNEEASVAKVVSDFRAALPDAVIYVYDNASTDRTAELAAEAGAVVRHEYRKGKGNVIRRMFREIDAECYVIVDGDDTYEASCAPQLADEVLSHGVDMAVGDRLSSTYFTENKRAFHNFGNSLMKKAVNSIFGSDIKDIMTGYRAFSYRFVKTFAVTSRGFEIETEMTVHAIHKNMSVSNVVVGYRDRNGSESKLNTFRDGARVIRTTMRLFRCYRPLKFFSIISALLTALSAAFMIPVLVEYFGTGLVSRFPTLIVCGFAFLAAIVSFFSGLILNTLVETDKQRFEMLLIAAENRLNDLKYSAKDGKREPKTIGKDRDD
ncbi:MAG: glycosyltransferase [Clostridia bacterium]|nr:glycosyltransferase [Clostridia bacterium]